MDNNMQKYKAFLKTVECGSFTKAAEALHYSQSGISRMIGDLEKEWNFALLTRDRGGVFLTSEGEQILSHIQALCQEYEHLKTKIDELNGLQSGLIRIASFSSVATHWLPKMIKAFQLDYPGIDYELVMGNYTEIEKWIENGQVDCGFLPLPVSSRFDVIPLAKDEFFVILPSNHPLADCKAFPIHSLCDYPFILPKTGERIDVEEIFNVHKIKPHVHFSTFDDYAIMSMVENGLGISILPKLILQRMPYDILLKPLEVPAYRHIGLILRNQDSCSLATRRFLQYVDYCQ